MNPHRKRRLRHALLWASLLASFQFPSFASRSEAHGIIWVPVHAGNDPVIRLPATAPKARPRTR